MYISQLSSDTYYAFLVLVVFCLYLVILISLIARLSFFLGFIQECVLSPLHLINCMYVILGTWQNQSFA